MYKNYFGFTDIPFSIAPDPRYLYLSEQHKDALAHLLYGVGEHGGFVLLTGEVGTGKTTICRCLLQQMPDNSDVAYIVNPRQSVVELLQSICDELGVYYFYEDQGTSYLVDLINEYLLESHSKGRNTILIIDEAQNLDADVLEQLRLLTNLETNEKKLLQLILLGQPELNELLDRQDLRQLAQRITARYHLQPLTLDEAERYVLHRLTVAGYSGELFPRDTLKLIHAASGGIPRLVNVICDRCLLGVYSANGRTVDVKLAKRAIAEVKGTGRERKKSGRPRWIFPLLGGLTVLAALGIVVYFLLPLLVPAKNESPSVSRQQNDADGLKQILQQQLVTASEIKLADGAAATDCESLKDTNFECVSSKENFNDFLLLDAEAVVELRRNDATSEWVLVARAGDEQAFSMRRVGAEPVRISERELRYDWAGNFIWVWERPPAYRENISLGEYDDFVQRLADAVPVERNTRSQEPYPLNRFAYLLANADGAQLPALVDIALLRRLRAAKERLDSATNGITPLFVRSLMAQRVNVSSSG